MPSATREAQGNEWPADCNILRPNGFALLTAATASSTHVGVIISADQTGVTKPGTQSLVILITTHMINRRA